MISFFEQLRVPRGSRALANDDDVRNVPGARVRACVRAVRVSGEFYRKIRLNGPLVFTFFVRYRNDY